MFFLKRFFSLQNYDWSLTIIVLILVAIGLAGIYSVDLSRGDKLTLFPTQVVALIAGIICFFVAGSMQVSFYRLSALLIYLFSLLLLVAVLFFGETIRGTTGWFRFGFFSFQPAEFAKIGLAVFLAYWINRFGRKYYRPRYLVSTFLVALLPVLLIFLQPDFGSALILLSVWFGLVILSGTKKRYIFLLIAVGLVSIILAWFFVLQNYQKDRLLTFIDPERDPLGAGYNVSQSIIAIGSGKFFGRGLGFGSQSQLHFLPEAQTDFIFSVIAEELGLVGATAVVVLYLLLLWRILIIAKNSDDDFNAYLVLAVFLLFFVQILINLGGALGFLPMTGITLPFLSYGGSSLVMNFLLLGIVHSVKRSTTNLWF